MQPLKLRLVISKYYCCVFDSSVINFDSSAKKKCLKSLTYASLNRHLIKYLIVQKFNCLMLSISE